MARSVDWSSTFPLRSPWCDLGWLLRLEERARQLLFTLAMLTLMKWALRTICFRDEVMESTESVVVNRTRNRHRRFFGIDIRFGCFIRATKAPVCDVSKRATAAAKTGEALFAKIGRDIRHVRL